MDDIPLELQEVVERAGIGRELEAAAGEPVAGVFARRRHQLEQIAAETCHGAVASLEETLERYGTVQIIRSAVADELESLRVVAPRIGRVGVAPTGDDEAGTEFRFTIPLEA